MLDIETDRIVSRIPVHYDVDQHHLDAGLFISAIECISQVMSALNRQLLLNSLHLEIVILPAEPGSFKQIIGVIVAGGSLIYTGLNSDLGQAYINGLTGHPSTYWAEKLGEITLDGVKHISQSNPVDEKGGEGTDFAVGVVTECAKAIMQITEEELARKELPIAPLRDAFAARNYFYQRCAAESEVMGIGFRDEPHFPIRRPDFARLQVRLPPEDEVWIVGNAVLTVTSPNWDELDHRRLWKGKDETSCPRYFYIRDEDFWSGIRSGKIKSRIPDTMEVQWAFKVVDGRRKDHIVLRVLEFNGKRLANPLDENALHALIGQYQNEHFLEISRLQRDLFD